MIERRISRAAPPKDEPEESDDPVARGREAWRRRKTDADVSWSDWVAIGKALCVGRQESKDKAKTNKPRGRRYNEAFHDWMEINGFGDLDGGDRSKLLQLIDRLPEIERWRATLPQTQRRRWNHPSTLWRAFTCKRRGPGAPLQRRPSAEPRNTFNASAEQADDAIEDDAEKATVGRLIVRANRLAGVARDFQNYSGELNEALVQTVEEVAQAWAETADVYRKRLLQPDEPSNTRAELTVVHSEGP